MSFHIELLRKIQTYTDKRYILLVRIHYRVADSVTWLEPWFGFQLDWTWPGPWTWSGFVLDGPGFRLDIMLILLGSNVALAWICTGLDPVVCQSRLLCEVKGHIPTTDVS